MSWIRHWFMKKDDFTLWGYFVILVVVSISAAFWLVGLLLQLLIYLTD